MHTNERALFIFAHQDDEVAIAPRIVQEVEAGNSVFCAYLTNGTAKGVPTETRCAESLRVLEELGAGTIEIAFIGNALGTADGQLSTQLSLTYQALLDWIATWQAPPSKLYFLAWEGGHHDHDAVHAIGLTLARHYPRATAWQFPLYNGYRTRGRFFRVMHALPNWGAPDILRLSLSGGLRFASLCASYPSQWRTWVGLFPGIFRAYVLQRCHHLYPVDKNAVAKPPHEGSLLYERMFGVDRASVLANVTALTQGN